MQTAKRNLGFVIAAAFIATIPFSVFGSAEARCCSGSTAPDSSGCTVVGHSTPFFTAGAIALDVTDFNHVTQAAGFPRATDYAIQIGGGAVHQYGRVIFDWGILGSNWPRQDAVHNRTLRLRTIAGETHIGFDILSSPRLAMFPYAGLNAGMFRLDLAKTNTDFGTLPAAGNTTSSITKRFTAVDLGLGFSSILGKSSDEGLTIGLRAGYAFDVSRQHEWRLASSDIGNAPSISYSGPYARIVVGKSFAFNKSWNHHHGHVEM